jgi:uncharacterized protein (DUF302 family)
MIKYNISKTVDLPYEKTIEKITEELKKEGFGILTSIDVQDTLKNKINVEFRRYVILGACNPTFAHQALLADEEIGLFLPCNVIVYEKDNKTHVSVFDPAIMSNFNAKVAPMANSVREKLVRVIAAV